MNSSALINVNQQGKLIYVVGSSGAGKDTILNAIRDDAQKSSVKVAKRYITREAWKGNEHHIELSKKSFKEKKEKGLFALFWNAHGIDYAIGTEIDGWLEKGEMVLMNGSRAYLDEAIKRYTNILVVWVTIDATVLQQRLICRGRDSDDEIRERIDRNNRLEKQKPRDCYVIDNSRDFSITMNEFHKMLKKIQ